MPERSELIASTSSVEQIRDYLSVESVEYLTMEDLRSTVDDPDNFCYACFNGDYQIPLAANVRKTALEDTMVEQ